MKLMRFFLLLAVFAATLPVSFSMSATAAESRAIPQGRAQIQMSYAPLVRQVSPAVVSIFTKRVITRNYSPFMNDPFFQRFFGEGLGMGGLTRKQVESALGSGVIIDPDGLIVTNAHVVRGAEEITITLSDGRQFDARKTLLDMPSDLALLRIDGQGQALPSISLKPSESLEVGDLVLAIGNPFGVGQTVTSGIVSALARSSLNINDFNFFIQTDAAINPGNSGGPLVAMDGGVIGINSAIFSKDGGSLGIGFAIPSEMVATVIAAEKAGQSGGDRGITRPWLGITAQTVSADIAQNLGLSVPHGVLIAALHDASPAKKAGVRVGDVVLAINGKDIREPAELKFRMATISIGGQASFDVLRKGQKLSMMVAAEAPPDDPPRDTTLLRGHHPLEGATVANINPAVAVELGISKDEGVVVMKVDERGQASRVVEAGDVILNVNNQDVHTIKDLKQGLAAGVAGWSIIVERDGHRRQIVIR